METLTKHTIQVFEHQLLRVGEVRDGVVFTRQHFEALAAYAERNTEKHYTLHHNGVRFTNYVGALQVGRLTIEILPKIDQADDVNIQHVLLDMLKACRILQPESPGFAKLSLRFGSLLDLYLHQYINEVAQILHQGLTKSYTPVAANRQVLKGRLLLEKQLQYNLAHRERFYTESYEFTYNHEYNILLNNAIKALTQLPVHPAIQFEAQQLLYRFPALKQVSNPLPNPAELYFTRQTKRYESAVRTALLILQQFQPDVRAGQLPVLAILFDMNALFEEFIYRQLKNAADKNTTVLRQVRQSFWERRYLQPDILLIKENQRIVLDTKWKRLQKANPEINDLRQLFVYNQYFDASRGMLVFPRMPGLHDLSPRPFSPRVDTTQKYYCQLVFVDLVKNGKLNSQIGKDLLQKLD